MNTPLKPAEALDRPTSFSLTLPGICADAFPDKSGPTESVQAR
ncbi:hypothetical protein [Pseudomonas sp. DSP3-2-2]